MDYRLDVTPAERPKGMGFGLKHRYGQEGQQPAPNKPNKEVRQQTQLLGQDIHLARWGWLFAFGYLPSCGLHGFGFAGLALLGSILPAALPLGVKDRVERSQARKRTGRG